MRYLETILAALKVSKSLLVLMSLKTFVILINKQIIQSFHKLTQCFKNIRCSDFYTDVNKKKTLAIK